MKGFCEGDESDLGSFFSGEGMAKSGQLADVSLGATKLPELPALFMGIGIIPGRQYTDRNVEPGPVF